MSERSTATESGAFPPYPLLEYVDTVASNEGHQYLNNESKPYPSQLGIGLVKAVCLAAHFGQNDAELTHWLASTVSAREPYAWYPYEKERYLTVREYVGAFFDNHGAERLAAAALTNSGASLETQKQKADFIASSWEICRERLPGDKLLKDTDSPQIHREIATHNQTGAPLFTFKGLGSKIDAFRDTTKLLRLFITVDREAIANGRSVGTFQEEPHESMVREGILAARSKANNLAFNQAFLNLGHHIGVRAVEPELRKLHNVWQHFHDEKFIPDAHRETVRSITLPEKVNAAVLRFAT